MDNPLGIGMRLHQWVFPLAVWRLMHGLELVRTVAAPTVTYLRFAKT